MHARPRSLLAALALRFAALPFAALPFTALRFAALRLSALLALPLALVVTGCGSEDCSNGSCECAAGHSCDFVCTAPPCHVDCVGDNPDCEGECGNGTCTCGEGSSCDFECNSGPCHVDCAGDNAHCEGTCANGTCTCGAGSSCEFDCLDDNCKMNCDGPCVVDCTHDEQSWAGCAINSCAAGEVTTCPDGEHLACGRDCPVEDP